MSYCEKCKYKHSSSHNEPCESCVVSLSEKDYPSNYEPIETLPKQPTIPPMPPVKQPKEEINHPERYAGGKYECIDVMIDVFGVEATKHFCLLNAFKYIWRQEHKNGVEDIKKASWYLNKYVELCGGAKND